MVAGPDSGPLICRSALPAPVCEGWLQALGDRGDGRSRPLVSLPASTCYAWLHAVAASPLGAAIVARLGPAPRCNLSHSFVRHGRPPHLWHQDGALRLDFAAYAGRALPADALLDMLTCWIALTPCGDHAPGLEWVAAPVAALLRPPELSDDAVLARFGSACRMRPLLQPGDVLLFDGALLHRTHLTPSMQAQRTSIELRFFCAGLVPQRLAGDAWAAWPA